MAVKTSWYTMDNKLGVDLNYPQTSITITTDPAYPAPTNKLGDRVQGENESEWMFVMASATISQYNCIAIDKNFKATNITSALVVSNLYTYGFAQFKVTQANTGDYFWALLKANAGVGINVSPSAQASAMLYLSFSGTAGAFTSSVTSNALNNVQLVVSISLSADNPGEGIVRSYPQFASNMSVIGAFGSA